MPKICSDRVLRVRLSRGADDRIALATDSAARALRASGIRAVLDDVPPGYAPDPVNIVWTDDPEESTFVRLWAGDDLNDPTVRRMVEAFRYAFRGAREFIARYERVNANLGARWQALGDDVGRSPFRPNR